MRRATGRIALRLLGWRAVGEFPHEARSGCVMLAVPHTSNWDLPFLIAFAMAFELRISWMGKHTLFEPPFGFLMHWIGGIPVRRGSPKRTVEEMAERFQTRRPLILVVAPEGTRGRAERWKSGFYWIAQGAGVPIVPSFLDYGTRTAGFGPILWPSGNLVADMDHLRAAYVGMRGLYPDDFGPVRLIEEESSDAA
jgi:1-acyl-sn-glycerol-3-phosphate acyltransferase